MGRIKGKRITAAVLVVVMMLSMVLTGWPANLFMRVSAAESTPGAPTMDTRVYANGTPVVIKDDGGIPKMYLSTDTTFSDPLFSGADIGNVAIYAGWADADYTGDTSITILSGTINGGIYAGSRLGKIIGNTNLTINGGIFGSTGNSIFAGGFQAITEGNTNITINDGTFSYYIFGGANEGVVTGNTFVDIKTGTFIYPIYGGGNTVTSTVNGNTNITITGGVFSNLFGGGLAGEVTGTATLSIDSATFISDIVICGGGEWDTAITGSTDVTIKNTTFSGQNNVYAGGMYGAITNDTKLYLKDCNSLNYVCGGGFTPEATVGGDTDVTIDGGTYNEVYGGGYYASVGGTAKMLIKDGTFKTVYAGNCGWNYEGYMTTIGSVDLTIEGGTFANVYGGSYYERVLGDAVTTIKGGTFTNEIVGGGIGGSYGADGDAILNIYPEAVINGAVKLNLHGAVYEHPHLPSSGLGNSKVNWYKYMNHDANGGTGDVPAKPYVLPGDTVIAAPANTFTAPSGFFFYKWNSKANGTGTFYAPGTEVTITEDNTTLYAIWKLIPDTSLWNGSGTQEDPYLISTAAQLAKIASELKRDISFDNIYFKMTNDIDLGVAPYNTGEGWDPIGTEANPFTSVFDGGGFAIKNIMINRAAPDQGLFGVIDGSAQIENLGIESGSVKGNSRSAGIVGYAKKGIITNCYNKATVTMTAMGYVGGIVGFNTNAEIKQCYNTGDITAQLGLSLAGGIAGSNSGSIDSCFNTGNVSVLTDSGVTEAGGIAGLNAGFNASITNCYNTGNISASRYVGGIVGVNDTKAYIANCYSTGSVTRIGSATINLMGGIAGLNNLIDNVISDCYYNNETFTGDAVGGGYNGSGSWDSSNVGTLINVVGLTTLQMLKADTLTTGAMIEIGNAFSKRDGDDANSYYPELNVLASSSLSFMQAASKDSATYVKTTPAATFPTASAVTYGAKLNTSALSDWTGVGIFTWVNETAIPKVSNTGYDVIFTPTVTELYLTVTQKVNITVNQKALTVNVTVNDKKYDGLNTATINTASLEGVVPGDTVILTNGTPTFASVGIGNAITISFTAFSIGGADSGNYTLTQPTDIKASITTGFTPVKDTHYTVTDLNSGWTNTDFVISAKSGFQVSLTNAAAGSWMTNLPSYATETDNGSVVFYVKNTATGEISVVKTESYKLDKTTPTAEVKYKTNGFKSFLNTVTFGLFFKKNLDVTIQGADTASGVAKVEYYQTDTQVTDPSTISGWVDGDSFNVTQDEKFILYVRITDTAGNKAIYYESVVVYTDSADTASGSFSKASSDDLTITVAMNGNTVKEIKIGSVTLTAETDYTTDTNAIIFKNTYLKSLADGTADFIVSYYPLGETGTADGISDAVGTTTVSIVIYTLPTNLTATYGDALSSVTLPTGWAWEDTGAVGNVGDQIRKAAYSTLTGLDLTVTVAPMPITVTADNKEKYFGAADPTLTYTVSPSLVSGDSLTGSLGYSGTEVGTYDITEDTAFTNPNYSVTFVKGTMIVKQTPSTDEVINIVDDLPNTITPDNINDVVDATNAFDALTDAEKTQIPQDTKDKLEEAQEQARLINIKDENVKLSAPALPWYVKIVAIRVSESDPLYSALAGKLTDKKVLAFYDIKLVNTITGEDYELPSGETVTVEVSGIDLTNAKNIVVAHEKADGTIEYITAAVSDNTVSFKTGSFSLYGIAADAEKQPDTGDSSNMSLWLLIGSSALIALCGMIVIERKRRRLKTV